MSHLNTEWTALRFCVCGKCDEKKKYGSFLCNPVTAIINLEMLHA
jgi:hypothetical protein